MIHDCKGHIIGFRRKTSELIERFNAQYGAVYGSLPHPQNTQQF